MTAYSPSLSQCESSTRSMLDSAASDYTVLASALIAVFMLDKTFRLNSKVSYSRQVAALLPMGLWY